MNAAAIRSACPVAARIEGSRAVPVLAPALPNRQLGLGGWVKVPLGASASDARVQLYDLHGAPCGIFVNPALADACIGALSR